MASAAVFATDRSCRGGGASSRWWRERWAGNVSRTDRQLKVSKIDATVRWLFDGGWSRSFWWPWKITSMSRRYCVTASRFSKLKIKNKPLWKCRAVERISWRTKSRRLFYILGGIILKNLRQYLRLGCPLHIVCWIKRRDNWPLGSPNM